MLRTRLILCICYRIACNSATVSLSLSVCESANTNHTHSIHSCTPPSAQWFKMCAKHQQSTFVNFAISRVPLLAWRQQLRRVATIDTMGKVRDE